MKDQKDTKKLVVKKPTIKSPAKSGTRKGARGMCETTTWTTE